MIGVLRQHTLKLYFRPASGLSGSIFLEAQQTISLTDSRLIFYLNLTTSVLPKMASIARKTLRLGMIPADGIGKEVLPVSFLSHHRRRISYMRKRAVDLLSAS